jgi:amidase
VTDSDSSDRDALSRRAFVKAGLAGGTLMLCGGALATAAAGDSTAVAANASAPPAVIPFELEEATIAQLQAGMQSGQYTTRSLVASYTARIHELNMQGPELRAVIELDPDAPAIAEALDRERREKGPRGPLHGIPILLKDNVGTHDRTTTTAGSLALAGSIPPRDAFVAARLRAAGAVFLGKANLSEWANFRSERSSSGWSSRGGQCRNPYALDRCPSGSSSGSAAATAASLCAAAVGSETDGSIVSPASRCGVVGFKPTLGLSSRTGVIPIAHSQDTLGPMARTVADAAALLGAMTGVDPDDEATAASSGKAETDYTRFLDAGGLRGARIGIYHPRSLQGNPFTDACVAEAIAAMRDGGAIVVDPVEIDSSKIGDPEYEVLLYEFKTDLNKYLASLGAGAPVHTLAETIAFDDAHKDTVMPYFGQDIFVAAQKKGSLAEKKYLDARAACLQHARTEGLDAAFAKHKLDAIVASSGGPAWLIDLVNGDSGSGGSSTLCAVAGYPNVTVPAGWAFGLPLGISFMGPPWSEGKLLRFAYAFEQATKSRRPPKFLPTAPLAPA